MLLLFTFSALVANPEKLLYYTVDNPARGLLNRGKTKKKKSLAAPPPPPPPPPYPPPRCSFGEKTKINRATHPHDVCLGATQVGVTQVSKCVRPGEMQSVCVCVCVCAFSSRSSWTSSSLDVPARVTQEEGHTGFLIHLPSAVRAFIFLARRIHPFLSLVDREVEFCVVVVVVYLTLTDPLRIQSWLQDIRNQTKSNRKHVRR